MAAGNKAIPQTVLKKQERNISQVCIGYMIDKK